MLKKLNRSVVVWGLIALAFLLGSLIVFVTVYVNYSSPYGLPLTSDGEIVWLLLAGILVEASALAGIGAVAAGTRDLERLKRALRRRSIDALLCLSSIALFFIAVALFADTGSNAPGGCPYGYDTCIGRPLGFGFGLLLVIAPMLITIVVLAIGAISAGLARSAASHDRGWLAVILVCSLGSLALAIGSVLALANISVSNPTVGVTLGILIVSPLFSPVATLIYSFRGQATVAE